MSVPFDETRSHAPERAASPLPETVHHQPREPRPSDRIHLPGYEILGELGRGGMGVVYRARQVQLDRTVALKMILASDHASEKELQRFQTEAQAVAQIQHPNIVQIFDVGIHEGTPYFTLEHLSGGSLADRIKDKPLPPKEAARIVQQVAEGMAFAHARGFVHRDLKPANVLFAGSESSPFGVRSSEFGVEDSVPSREPKNYPVAHSELPKIADFGLAKRYDIEETGLTRTGAVLGTPAYMSPEQASGKTHSIGPATDIYAMGVILYQCVTGTVPFRGANIQEVFQQIWSQEPVSPKSLLPSVPPDICTICLKCLEKDSTKRYPSASALAEDLRRFQADESILARPASKLERMRKWARRNRLMTELSILLVIALIVGTAISIGYAIQAHENLEAARKSERKAEAESKAARTSEDETRRALKRVQDEQERTRAALESSERNLGETRLILAQNLWNAKGPAEAVLQYLDSIPERFRAWEWHVLRRRYGGSIYVVPLSDRAVRRVGVSRDGRRIAALCDDGFLHWIDGRTGRVFQRVATDPSKACDLSVSADGRRAVTIAHSGTVQVWDADGGTCERSFGVAEQGVNRVALSADGRLAAVESAGRLRLWDADTGSMLREFRNDSWWSIGPIAISPDGRHVAGVTRRGVLKIWDAATGRLEAEQSRQFNLYQLQFNADGSHLLALGAGAVLTFSPTTAGLLKETSGAIGLHFAIGDDERRLFLAGGDFEIDVWDRDRRESVPRLRGHTKGITDIQATADGSRVVTASEDGTVRLWDATREVPLPRLPGVASYPPAVSDDGSRIAVCEHDRTARVWDAATGLERLRLTGHTDEVTCVAMSGDGHRVVTGSADRTLRVWDGRTGRCLRELTGHGSAIRSLAISRDGRRIVSGAEDGAIRYWDTERGVCLREDPGLAFAVESLAIDATGRRFASSTALGVRIWDTRGERPRDLQFLAAGSVVAIDGRGERVFTTEVSPALGKSVRVRVWDAETGRAVVELPSSTFYNTGLAVNAGGDRIAYSGTRGNGTSSLTIGDRVAQHAVLEFTQRGERHLRVATNRDGTIIVFTSPDEGAALLLDGLPWSDAGTPPSEAESLRRRWLSRPDPSWHAERIRIANVARDDYTAQLHASHEQHAHGVVALDHDRWDDAFLHFVAAAALKPKPPEPPEVLPVPKMKSN